MMASRLNRALVPNSNSAAVSASVLQSVSDRDVIVSVDAATSAVIRRLRVSPNGRLLALGDDDGWIRIVRLDNFEVAAAFPAHNGRVRDLDFNPDSRILLSAGQDN